MGRSTALVEDGARVPHWGISGPVVSNRTHRHRCRSPVSASRVRPRSAVRTPFRPRQSSSRPRRRLYARSRGFPHRHLRRRIRPGARRRSLSRLHLRVQYRGRAESPSSRSERSERVGRGESHIPPKAYSLTVSGSDRALDRSTSGRRTPGRRTRSHTSSPGTKGSLSIGPSGGQTTCRSPPRRSSIRSKGLPGGPSARRRTDRRRESGHTHTGRATERGRP